MKSKKTIRLEIDNESFEMVDFRDYVIIKKALNDVLEKASDLQNKNHSLLKTDPFISLADTPEGNLCFVGVCLVEILNNQSIKKSFIYQAVRVLPITIKALGMGTVQ